METAIYHNMEEKKVIKGLDTPFDEAVDTAKLHDIKDISYEFNTPSKTGEILHLNDILKGDLETETKVRIIDRFIREEIKDESLKDSEIGFNKGLKQLTERLGISLINEIQKGNALKILNRLFQEVAIRSNLSSVSFLQKMKEEVRQAKIKDLKQQLKTLSV